MITPKVSDIIKVMKAKGYSVFENESKPFNLNIVAIRCNSDINSNTYNDLLIAFYKYQGYWEKYTFECTTDPGLDYRLNPIAKTGTAILLPGQYKNMLRLGLHQGKYEALVQQNKCTVIRDSNKDSSIDTKPSNIVSNVVSRTEANITTDTYFDSHGNIVFLTETGIFGINIHDQRANEGNKVGKWSAGCTVLRYKANLNTLLDLCKSSLEYFSNNFTYTLLEEDDFKRT